jgi:hypothetical protein
MGGIIVADRQAGEPRNLRVSVKAPLMFSAFLAVVAFLAVLIFASGGSSRSPRFDLAFIAGGIAFIVSLVIAAMLAMSFKENAEHLGKGSGVNLSSRKAHGGHGAYRAGFGSGTTGGPSGGSSAGPGADPSEGTEPESR